MTRININKIEKFEEAKMKTARGKTKAGSQVLIGLFILMGLLVPGYLGAETGIAVTDLGQIQLDKTRLWSPGRLAVGGDGTLYVVDSYKNRILMFDRSGNHRGDLFVPKVSAVAVTADGTLYAGSHASYSVAIIKNGRTAGYLGRGENEFKSVRDIAVDEATGMVYVADNAGNAVRIFDASGLDLGSLGGVHLPISVEIAGDELYVLDAPLMQNGMPSLLASRIAVFDRSMNLTRTIDEYGAGAAIIRPTDLAVSGGMLFVSDAALKTVAAFDMQGTYAGDFPGQVDLPVSVAVSSDGLVYVSSNLTHSIKVYAINGRLP